jgi:hypothetical protein
MPPSSCTTKSRHKKFETPTTTNIKSKFGFYISWLERFFVKENWIKQTRICKERIVSCHYGFWVHFLNISWFFIVIIVGSNLP